MADMDPVKNDLFIGEGVVFTGSMNLLPMIFRLVGQGMSQAKLKPEKWMSTGSCMKTFPVNITY